MPAIVLATLNARWSHASLGLRCLRANLGALRDDSEIAEYTIARPAREIVADLLARAPRIVGFGVYIWNVAQTTEVIARLKAAAPEVTVVVGGPEVSHEVESQRICRLADYVITGWGDLSFAQLARQILHGPRPLMKVHAGEQPPLAMLALPYGEYADTDIARRHLYVEASRGCPFKCEFCLSALDKTAWPFPLDAFLQSLDALWRRGARRFKFVDRTFNLKVDTSAAILDFFLGKLDADPADPPFVHFELIPDHLPDRLRERIARFPAGSLQFEIGIQSWSADVQRNISRRQDNAAAEANLRWLRAHTQAHLHVDLIAGLPGEDLASFARGVDRLLLLAPHEIQLGLLKRLRGAPIARHTQAFALDFNPAPPYALRSSRDLSAEEVQRLARAAQLWDRVLNSGRFPRSAQLLLGTPDAATGAAFLRFLGFADAVVADTGRGFGHAVEDLAQRLQAHLVARGLPAATVRAALADDYAGSGAEGRFELDGERIGSARRARSHTAALARQARHGRALRAADADAAAEGTANRS
jgi:radical SAM superfamily enzyme YgiQ (UPF0313 family)